MAILPHTGVVKAILNQGPVSTAHNIGQALMPSFGFEAKNNLSLPIKQKFSANFRSLQAKPNQLESDSGPEEGRNETDMKAQIDSTSNLERLTLTTEEVMLLTGWSRELTRARIGSLELPNVGTQRRFLVSRAHLRRFLGERP
jgi:hypothetical protein